MRSKERAASMVEYILIVLFLVIIAIPAMGFVGDSVGASFRQGGETIAGGESVTTMNPAAPNIGKGDPP